MGESRIFYQVYSLALTSTLDLPLCRIAEFGGPKWHFELVPDPQRESPSQDWSVLSRLRDDSPWMLLGKHQGSIWLRFPAMVDFEIQPRRRRIAGYASANVPQETITHLFLDQVLPRVAAHDGMLVIHAGAVTINQRIVGFLGSTGTGKSTLVASLCQEGYPLITDDCLALVIEDSQVLGYPGYPGLRLWEDSVSAVAGPSAKTGYVAHYTAKQRVDVATTSVPFSCQPQPLDRLYFLESPEFEVTEIKATYLTPREALFSLLNGAFRLGTGDRKRNQREFEMCLQIAQTIPFFRLSYPRNYASLEAARRIIVDNLIDV